MRSAFSKNNKTMKLRITAIHDVTIRASMPGHEARQIGNSIVYVPKETESWVSIKSGESVITGLVLGVHPSCVRNEFPMTIRGVAMVLMPGYGQSDLPQEFFGLFHMDVADEDHQ